MAARRPAVKSSQQDWHRLSLIILTVLIFATMALTILVASAKIHSLEASSLHRYQDGPLPAALSFSKSRQQKPPANDDDSTSDIPSAILQDPERQPILKILREAGYDFSNATLFTPETWKSLPRWTDVMDLYGEPKILGLETCQRYRELVANPKLRELGVAGMFDSGTNVLHSTLVLNCHNDQVDGGGVLWQVPWGKHMPVSERSQHVAKGNSNRNYTHVLPVVSVRDPYTWLQSMCRQPYAVQFDHSTDPEQNLCPNIVPYPEDIKLHPRYGKMKYLPATAKYIKGTTIKYLSIAHIYNEWYNAYANVTEFPRLIVRMEDLIFHGDEVLPKVCECFGGVYNHEVRRTANVVNRNSGIDTSVGSGLLRSVIKYGNKALRRKHYQKIQLEAAKEVLDPHLMELFGYSYENP